MAIGNTCRVSGCEKTITQKDTALCAMHKGRWGRHKSFDPPQKFPRICIIHGELTINDIRIKDKRKFNKEGLPIISRMCKHCDNANAKAWKAKTGYKAPIRAGRHKQRLYGISEQQYQSMLLQQNGKCAICRKEETRILHGKVCALSVDHCHKTGKVRQLLCHQHNLMIGYAEDSEEIMQEGLNYIRRHAAAE